MVPHHQHHLLGHNTRPWAGFALRCEGKLLRCPMSPPACSQLSILEKTRLKEITRQHGGAFPASGWPSLIYSCWKK